jgi:hypothetical protein
MTVALIALFIALGGTATAVTTAIVPLAKRALVADNAKKLQGQTASQTVQGLIEVKTRSVGIAPNQEGYADISCDAGQRVIAGGYRYGDDDYWIDDWGSYPKDEDTWSVYVYQDPGDPSEWPVKVEDVTLYAVCVN